MAIQPHYTQAKHHHERHKRSHDRKAVDPLTFEKNESRNIHHVPTHRALIAQSIQELLSIQLKESCNVAKSEVINIDEIRTREI